MKFKNPEYQRKHDELAANLKRITGKDLDDEFEKWKQAGYPQYKCSEDFQKEFEKWRDNPRKSEIERNEKMMVESLREIVANLGKNQYKEDRKKRKSSSPKRKCKCKK
jgi:hypothetical protein